MPRPIRLDLLSVMAADHGIRNQRDGALGKKLGEAIRANGLLLGIAVTAIGLMLIWAIRDFSVENADNQRNRTTFDTSVGGAIQNQGQIGQGSPHQVSTVDPVEVYASQMAKVAPLLISSIDAVIVACQHQWGTLDLGSCDRAAASADEVLSRFQGLTVPTCVKVVNDYILELTRIERQFLMEIRESVLKRDEEGIWRSTRAVGQFETVIDRQLVQLKDNFGQLCRRTSEWPTRPQG
jgi:hypothetical protein